MNINYLTFGILFENVYVDMSNRILEFIKTHHFLYSQWNRKIDNQMLYKILLYVDCSKDRKDIVIVLPSFLCKKGLTQGDKNCLILIIKKNLLITAYWCNDVNYLMKRKKSNHFQILK